MKKLLLILSLCVASYYYTEAQVSIYSFAQSSGTYTPITGGTVLGDSTNDDDRFVDPANLGGSTTTTGVGFPIGFSFWYNNDVFDRFAVNTNGWISLGKSTLTPSVNNASTSAYTPISSTSTITPSLLRNRIAAFARDLDGQFGSELRVETIGTAPNRICVIQWKGYKKYYFSNIPGDNLNFQIRLKETSNVVEVVYGTVTNNSNSALIQVGLGGTANTDYNNRKTTSNWASTTAGTADTNTMTLTSTVKPASGQIYTWTPPALCSGTPAAGTASSSSASVCSGVSFDLTLTGYTTGVSGLSFQWQKSSAIGGPFTNISGATSPTYTATQTATTYYQCVVTCSGGSSASSNIVTVTMNTPTNCYCTPPSTTCTSSDVITNVTIGTLNNTTTCGTNGYTNYTTPVTTLNKPLTYPMSVTVGSGGTEHVAVWIDYNQNGVFETTEFTALGSGIGVTINGSITIPNAAMTGNTRMRVRVRYNTPLTGGDACISYAYGETEDYMVTIGTAPACSGTPTAGTATASQDTVCSEAFDLILTGYNMSVSGLSFQWQSSSTQNGTFTNIPGATTPIYSATQTSTTFYKCVVTCGGSSATSTVVSVVSRPFINCYCAPVNGGSACMTNITLNTLNRTSAGCENSPNYYTAVPVGTATTTLTGGQSYPMSVTLGSSAAILSVWIDYNQNGVYETTEWTQIATNALASSTSTVNVVIPGAAVPGQTGMRVRSRSTGSPNGAADACTSMLSGETEDYIVTIVAAPACSGTPTAGTASVSNDTVCSETFDLILTGYDMTVSGLSFQWQSSTTQNGTFTDIAGATTPIYTTTQSATTYYKVLVTCNGGTPVSSNVVTVVSTPVLSCYCTPVHSSACSSNNNIDSVSIVGTTLMNFGTGCTSTNGMAYTKYPATGSTTASLTAGSTYVFTVTTTSNNIISVWIDYNRNGVYESTEWNQVSTTSVANIANTVSITIPSTTTSGITGMRIRSRSNGSSNSSGDACTSFASGETEDYLVNIIAASNVGITESTLQNNVVVYPNPTAGIFNVMVSGTKFTELGINVIDLQGKVVYSAIERNTGADYNKQINLEGLAKGLYYVKVSTENGVSVQKLVVQ